MKIELKPCPFCGSDRITVWNIRDGQQAICKECKSTGTPTFHGKDGREATWGHAVEAWNRRAALAEQTQQGVEVKASPCVDSRCYSAAETIAKIGQIASGVGFQANVPALDIAGQIVSILSANPEHIDRFMVEGAELFLDGTFNPDQGSLTYRAVSGAILYPSVLREKKGQQQ